MNKPLTIKQLEHKRFLKGQSISRSIEKNKNELENKIGSFSDIVSHNLKEFINPSEFNKVNQLRISKANSIEHEIKKSEIFTKLIHKGLNVLVEPKCLDTSIRPDILVLDVIPCIAYEVVVSESEISLLKKEVKYPFKIKVVRLNE